MQQAPHPSRGAGPATLYLRDKARLLERAYFPCWGW